MKSWCSIFLTLHKLVVETQHPNVHNFHNCRSVLDMPSVLNQNQRDFWEGKSGRKWLWFLFPEHQNHQGMLKWSRLGAIPRDSGLVDLWLRWSGVWRVLHGTLSCAARVGDHWWGKASLIGVTFWIDAAQGTQSCFPVLVCLSCWVEAERTECSSVSLLLKIVPNELPASGVLYPQYQCLGGVGEWVHVCHTSCIC
jgi:hypothetical protein